MFDVPFKTNQLQSFPMGERASQEGFISSRTCAGLYVWQVEHLEAKSRISALIPVQQHELTPGSQGLQLVTPGTHLVLGVSTRTFFFFLFVCLFVCVWFFFFLWSTVSRARISQGS